MREYYKKQGKQYGRKKTFQDTIALGIPPVVLVH